MSRRAAPATSRRSSRSRPTSRPTRPPSRRALSGRTWPMRARDLLLPLAATLLGVVPLRAQTPPAQAVSSKSAPPSDEPKLIFDREVFEYPAEGRRDPFTPLVGKNDM